MSHARKRLLIDMVKDAGLELVGTELKSGRIAAEVKAPNGVVRTFTISSTSRIDPRGDLNEQARIKRFARENPAPGAKEETPDMAKKDAAPVTHTPDELTPGEFYKLCVWLTDVILAKDPESLDALAALAGAHFGRVIGTATMREAMKATDTAEPEAWTKLPDPHVIFARELESMLGALGQEPSAVFKRYLATLA